MKEEVYFEKGITPSLFRKFLVDNYGSTVIEGIVAQMSPQAQAMTMEPDANSWYPVSLMREFYDTIARELEPQEPEILTRMGRFVADESAKGVLRYLTRLISVPTLISRMGAFWRNYHKGGGIQAEIIRKTPDLQQGVLTIFGYPAGPHGRKAMQGYIEATLERAGARDPSFEPNPDKDNSLDTYSWLLSWR